MLSRISLAGFRACVDASTLELGPLTVLAGANNTGKSSFISALLALIQSEQAASRHWLVLSGDWVDLGPFDELLSPDRQTFSIGIEGDVGGSELAVVWDFGEVIGRRSRPEARIIRLAASVGADQFESEVDGEGMVVDISEYTSTAYDQAFLLHPTSVYLPSSSMPESLPLLPYGSPQVLAVGPYRAPPTRLSPYRVGPTGSLVGQYGQFAAEAFAQARDRACDLWPPGGGEADDTVAAAMNAWWRYILDEDVSVRVEDLARVGFSVRVDTSGISNRSLGQVGFGLSQLWPILVACLSSRPGELVIIETPEAHLHPGAQHRVSQLFVELARRGRQVIVETHSEHVVAAASLAVKRKELEPEALALSYFSQVGGRTVIQRITVDGTGRRLSQPRGFFDQSAQELLELLEPS